MKSITLNNFIAYFVQISFLIRKIFATSSLFWEPNYGLYDPSIHAPKACAFPSRWYGQWSQASYDTPLILSHNEITNKGVCLAQVKQRYLLYNEEQNCYQCLFITEKHYNVLQYKESYCGPKNTLQVICDQIGGDAFLHTLFRANPSNIKCPFGDERYTFQYTGDFGTTVCNGENVKNNENFDQFTDFSQSFDVDKTLIHSTTFDDKIGELRRDQNNFWSATSFTNQNYLDKCTNPSQLLFRFQTCDKGTKNINDDNQETTLNNFFELNTETGQGPGQSQQNGKTNDEPILLNFKLSCMAEWRDGSKNYLAGFVDFWHQKTVSTSDPKENSSKDLEKTFNAHLDLNITNNASKINAKTAAKKSLDKDQTTITKSNVQNFRCFIYEKTAKGYILSMSYDSSCFGIFSAQDGPHVFELQTVVKDMNKIGDCTFPAFFGQHLKWPLLNKSGYYETLGGISNPNNSPNQENRAIKSLHLYRKNLNWNHPIEKMSCYKQLPINNKNINEYQDKFIKPLENRLYYRKNKENFKKFVHKRQIESTQIIDEKHLIINEENIKSSKYIVYTVFGCFHGFKCLIVHQRSRHIVELQEGFIAPSPHLACTKDYFDPSRLSSSIRYSTLAVETTSEELFNTLPCPFAGLYQISPNQAHQPLVINDNIHERSRNRIQKREDHPNLPRKTNSFISNKNLYYHQNTANKFGQTATYYTRHNSGRNVNYLANTYHAAPIEHNQNYLIKKLQNFNHNYNNIKSNSNKCSNVRKFSILDFGCHKPNLMAIHHFCPSDLKQRTISLFKCHAHWEENGVNYVISSEYHSKYLNCFVIKEDKVTNTLHITNTQGVCKRNVDPNVDGIMRYQARSRRDCPTLPDIISKSQNISHAYGSQNQRRFYNANAYFKTSSAFSSHNMITNSALIIKIYAVILLVYFGISTLSVGSIQNLILFCNVIVKKNLLNWYNKNTVFIYKSIVSSLLITIISSHIYICNIFLSITFIFSTNCLHSTCHNFFITSTLMIVTSFIIKAYYLVNYNIYLVIVKKISYLLPISLSAKQIKTVELPTT